MPKNSSSSNYIGKTKSERGFAAMPEAKQKEIARKGGEAVSEDREHMSAIGRKGGETVSRDREHMAEIGRKGGEAVSSDRDHMAQIGRKGGENSGGGTRAEDEPKTKKSR